MPNRGRSVARIPLARAAGRCGDGALTLGRGPVRTTGTVVAGDVTTAGWALVGVLVRGVRPTPRPTPRAAWAAGALAGLLVGASTGVIGAAPAFARDDRTAVSGTTVCDPGAGQYTVTWTVEDKLVGPVLSLAELPTNFTYKTTSSGAESPVPELLAIPQHHAGGSGRVYLVQRLPGSSTQARLHFAMVWDGGAPEPFETSLALAGDCRSTPLPAPATPVPLSPGGPSPSVSPGASATGSAGGSSGTVVPVAECDGRVVVRLTHPPGTTRTVFFTVTANHAHFTATVPVARDETKMITVPAQDATGILVYDGAQAWGSPIIMGPIDWTRPERCEEPVVEGESDCGTLKVRVVNAGSGDIRAVIAGSTGSREVVIAGNSSREVLLPGADDLVAQVIVGDRHWEVRYRQPTRCGPFHASAVRWVLAGGGALGLVGVGIGGFVLLRRRRLPTQSPPG